MFPNFLIDKTLFILLDDLVSQISLLAVCIIEVGFSLMDSMLDSMFLRTVSPFGHPLFYEVPSNNSPNCN